MILVTGATGNVGRELVRELDAKGARFRVLVRDLTRASSLPASAERAVGDWADPATLTSAFEGADGLFLLTPGIGTEAVARAVAAARAAGVSHIVHLSSFNVLGDPMPAMGRWHHQREETIRASGVPATFLRPGGFMSNALEWLGTIRDGGYVLDPVGPGRYAPIDPADIAAVAAIVLTEGSRHHGKEYVLTGAELLTISEQARIFARALGRDIEVREPATPDDVVRARFPHGAPPALAEAILEGFRLMRSDQAAFRTDVVEQLLGRQPATFVDWCRRHVVPEAP